MLPEIKTKKNIRKRIKDPINAVISVTLKPENIYIITSFCLPQLDSSLPSLHSGVPSQIHFRWIHFFLSLHSHSFLRHFGGGGVGRVTTDGRKYKKNSQTESTGFRKQGKAG